MDRGRDGGEGPGSSVSGWPAREAGPTCFCGWPTFVDAQEGHLPILICIFHRRDAGASFPLPLERPDNWPNLSREELQAFMERGEKEHEASDGG